MGWRKYVTVIRSKLNSISLCVQSLEANPFCFWTPEPSPHLPPPLTNPTSLRRRPKSHKSSRGKTVTDGVAQRRSRPRHRQLGPSEHPVHIFFKDRNYLDMEWDHYFTGAGRKKNLLEIRCGVGNTIIPLIARYPAVFVHACDFSQKTIRKPKELFFLTQRSKPEGYLASSILAEECTCVADILFNLTEISFNRHKSLHAHNSFTEARINAFVCDLTTDDLREHIDPSSVDIVTMMFVLSTVSPDKMTLVLKNIRHVLKPNGVCCYVIMPLRAFYFSEEYLRGLFRENGYEVEELGLRCKQVENRSRELVMNRRIQAVFRMSHENGSCKELSSDESLKEDNANEVKDNDSMEIVDEVGDDIEIDMSEGMTNDMFGLSLYNDEIVDINVGNLNFKIRVLPKEYQHTCKSTGLMLWESARFISSILVGNPSILEGKRVLELGCGSAGICSIIAARSADLVVATDGDARAPELLCRNIASNILSPYRDKLHQRALEWGNPDHIDNIKTMNDEGFDLIIGTDVTYVSEAIVPLFATAQSLISSDKADGDESEAALVLCYVLRRVEEPSILCAACRHGFVLVNKWPGRSSSDPSKSVMASWFTKIDLKDVFSSKALNILYFRRS
ncbi:tRNA N(3)-methylcytidine methyltransferase METTL6-like protein [Drosera capensis]